MRTPRIRNVLGRPFSIVLWQYPADAPVGRLLAHYRMAKIIAYAWMTSSTLMASTAFDFLFSDGWKQRLSLVILLISCGISLVSAIPGILALAWAGEIEKTLQARGLPLPDGRSICNRMPGVAMKMCFWFAVVVLGVHLLH